MIQMCKYDFIAGFKLTADRTAYRDRKRGHVWSEDDLIRIAPEKIAHSCACRVDHSIGAMASSVGAICVGVRFLQIVTDGFNHLLRNLCASGSIKKNGWL